MELENLMNVDSQPHISHSLSHSTNTITHSPRETANINTHSSSISSLEHGPTSTYVAQNDVTNNTTDSFTHNADISSIRPKEDENVNLEEVEKQEKRPKRERHAPHSNDFPEPSKKEKKEKHHKKKRTRDGNSVTPATKDTNSKNPKRQYELEAYSAVISAFRAQGELTWKKETILQELRGVLKISEDRHKMELKRVEETISSSTVGYTRVRKEKRSNPYDIDPFSSQESQSSEWESNLDEETGKLRKRQKVAKDDQELPALMTQPLPHSDNQPATVNKLAAKVSKTKKVTKEKEKKRGRKPRAQKSTEKDEKLKSDPQGVDQLDLSSLVQDGSLPPDILEARNRGDLERLKEALEAHKEKVRAELEQLQREM